MDLEYLKIVLADDLVQTKIKEQGYCPQDTLKKVNELSKTRSLQEVFLNFNFAIEELEETLEKDFVERKNHHLSEKYNREDFDWLIKMGITTGSKITCTVDKKTHNFKVILIFIDYSENACVELKNLKSQKFEKYEIRRLKMHKFEVIKDDFFKDKEFKKELILLINSAIDHYNECDEQYTVLSNISELIFKKTGRRLNCLSF